MPLNRQNPTVGSALVACGFAAFWLWPKLETRLGTQIALLRGLPWLPIAAGGLLLLVVGLLFWALPDLERNQRVCDRLVDTILTTKDRVELERAAILSTLTGMQHRRSCSVMGAG